VPDGIFLVVDPIPYVLWAVILTAVVTARMELDGPVPKELRGPLYLAWLGGAPFMWVWPAITLVTGPHWNWEGPDIGLPLVFLTTATGWLAVRVRRFRRTG
jgi:hypothetical protein